MAGERHVDVWGREAPATEPVEREAQAERVLAAAVLHLAFEDLEKHRDAREVRRRRVFRDARTWVESDERRWPFSFLNVCDLLDLSPEALRAKLRALRN
ncbi:MAG: hypothetical protein B6D46_00900 [Polyangiaceae bacterium UTPRO1]|nr:hypothetical protein [Myxococcales bacterium]OQY69076.1 MAG: hypothetical protein B6D46_00900 [Polyangiaceae bacterium UTPRO1]